MAIREKSVLKNATTTNQIITEFLMHDILDSALGVVQEDTKLNIRSHNEGSVAGNIRGDNSVDLQTKRSSLDHVAAGVNSSIIGGENNGITSTGTHSAIIGGKDNHSCSGKYSLISGSFASNNALSYARVHGGGLYARIIDLVAKNQTTDDTPTALTLGGESESPVISIVIPDNTTWGYTISVVARRTDAAGERAFFKFTGCIDNDGTTVADVGNILKEIIARDNSAWDVNVSADDSTKSILITVTGETGKTINWTARIDITQADG